MNKFNFTNLWIMVNETKDELISLEHETLTGLYHNTLFGKLRKAKRALKWQKKQK